MDPVRNIVIDNCESDFTIIDIRETLVTKIELAAQVLRDLPKTYEASKLGYFSFSARSIDINKEVSEKIKDLSLFRELNEEEQNIARSYIFTAYNALQVLIDSGFLNEETKKMSKNMSYLLNVQFGGYAKEISILHSLMNLTAGLADLEGLLDLNENTNSLEIVKNKKQTNKTKDCLHNIFSLLKKDEFVNQFSVKDIMHLKLTLFWLMSSYLKAYQNNKDLSEHNFAILHKMNESLSLNLSKRDVSKFDDIEDSTFANLLELKEKITSTFYFKDFWIHPGHTHELNEFNHYITMCAAFLKNPSSLNLNNLTMLGRDDKAGIALYESNAENSEDVKTLVAFAFNNDSLLSYYNFSQVRTTGLSLGGLAHTPVISASETAWESLKKLVQNDKDKFADNYQGKKINLITSGFGLDGAIAQLLSYLWANEDPKSTTHAYCLGVPPVLDINAAGKIREQENHYALNFELKDDTLLKISMLSGFVSNEYSSDNFKATYPLYNRNKFATDFTSHDKLLYLDKIKEGVLQPTQMSKIMEEISNLIINFGNSSKKDRAYNLAKIYANHPNAITQTTATNAKIN